MTSEASIRYKDEERLLNDTDNVDRIYIEEILPAKMKVNLEVIRNFQLRGELLTMLRTVLSMLKKDTGETEREISAKR